MPILPVKLAALATFMALLKEPPAAATCANLAPPKSVALGRVATIAGALLNEAATAALPTPDQIDLERETAVPGIMASALAPVATSTTLAAAAEALAPLTITVAPFAALPTVNVPVLARTIAPLASLPT